MILDRGICTIFRRINMSLSGEMPKPGYVLYWKSWYGELDFATSDAHPTEGREERKTDARIRIQQNRDLRQHDVVVLQNIDRIEQADGPVYEITRAWHGQDDGSPAEISDLTLEVMEP